MNYTFPIITHVDQVREAIAGRPEFFEAEREHFRVFNYFSSGPKVFVPVIDEKTAILRECRGLIFSRDGNLISRPFSKFFNVGEMDETHSGLIDLRKPHVLLEKLDGSMIRPIPIGKCVRWGTKMGITDVALQAETFVSTRPEYISLALECIKKNKTPIFEWCSPKQRIVIDYKREDLVLTGIRDNTTGIYTPYSELDEISLYYDITLVQRHDNVDDILEFLARAAHEEDHEGYVIRFDDGHMVKIKNNWYTRIHRAVSSLIEEKDVVKIILNEDVDDLLGVLAPDDKKTLELFNHNFWIGLTSYCSDLVKDLCRYHLALKGDRKRFALEIAPTLEKSARSLMYQVWDEETNLLEMTINNAKKLIHQNLSTKTRSSGVRHIWGNHKWNYRLRMD